MRSASSVLGYWARPRPNSCLGTDPRLRPDRERVEAAPCASPSGGRHEPRAILDDRSSRGGDCRPAHQHAPDRAGARRGKHVFVEKPSGATSRGRRHRAVWAEECCVGHITQYSPGLRPSGLHPARGDRPALLPGPRPYAPRSDLPGSDVLTESRPTTSPSCCRSGASPCAVHAWGAARLDLGRADSACLLVECRRRVRPRRGGGSARRQRQATPRGPGDAGIRVVDGRERLSSIISGGLGQLARGGVRRRPRSDASGGARFPSRTLAEELRAFVACVETVPPRWTWLRGGRGRARGRAPLDGARREGEPFRDEARARPRPRGGATPRPSPWRCHRGGVWLETGADPPPQPARRRGGHRSTC